MFDKITEIVGKLKPDYWVYIAIGIIGLVFIVGLIVSLGAGELRKFKKAAKAFNENPNNKTANDAAKAMPVKIKKLYKRCKATGEKPSDVINVDACVFMPFASSFASKFTKAVLYTSVIMVPFVYAACTLSLTGLTDAAEVITSAFAPYVGILLVAVAGLLFTLFASLISRSVFNGAMKTYNEYVDKLDAMSKGGNFENVSLDDGAANVSNNNVEEVPVGKAKKDKKDKKSNKDENIIDSGAINNFDIDSVEEASVVMEETYNTFESPTRINVELEDESNNGAQSYIERETIIETVSSGPSAMEIERRALEEEIRAEKEKAEKERAERARESANLEIKAREEMRAAAIERARAAQNAKAESAVPSEPIIMAAPASKAAEPAAAANTASADEVIARIEQINREGAPIATMKEVALLLQQERAKPENKTPEQQKKLNEALSSLLKAMSSANKR